MSIFNLRRGTLVRAKRDLDPRGANVPLGTIGVVFEEANFYGDEAGPMVQWFPRPPKRPYGGVCNVYEHDVEILEPDHEHSAARIDRHTQGAAVAGRAPYIGHFTIEDGLLSLWDKPQPTPTYFAMAFTSGQRLLIERMIEVWQDLKSAL